MSAATARAAEQELESLMTVIHYFWRHEQRHCEINYGGAPDNHIFRHLETLRRHVMDEQWVRTLV